MKENKSSFSWQDTERQFLQSRIVELPVCNFQKAQNAPVFEVSSKTQHRMQNMVNEQLRTVYHSVWMMLDKMDYVERVQGISPKFMTEEQCLNEILPIVRNAPAFREGFQLYDSGNYGGSYTGGCESGSDGKDDGFSEYGRIVDFSKDVQEIEESILDRRKVWKGVCCVYERNLAILKYRIDKHIILQEIRKL